jgi:3',5'-cyclic AMP phosphodiesterase CpdA
MFTLAHISDVHLGPLPNLTFLELLSKRVTGYVNWRRNRGKQLFGNTLERLLEEIVKTAPSHLAITGDLVNLALNFEMDAAAQWLHAFHRPHDVSVVPGNHDAYVPGALDTAIKLWKPWMSGDAPREDGHDFPYLRIRDNVALIGVSTATATPPFMASGFFGPNQARRFERLLKETGEQGLFRVVMIHHPPIRGATANYKRMIGIRRFHAALHMDGAELVLHGHTHLNTTYWIEGKTGRTPVVGIASGSQSFGGHKPSSAYNLFHIGGKKGGWTLSKERFSLQKDGDTFAKDHDEVLLGEGQRLSR